MFYKKGALKNFAKFTEKDVYQGLFKWITIFTEHLWVTTSGKISIRLG